MSDAKASRSPTRSTLKLGMAQMCSSNTHQRNIETLEALAEEAHRAGVELLALPEASGLLNRDVAAARLQVTDEANDPFLAVARRLAAQYGIWIHTGSTPLSRGKEPRFSNSSHLIDPSGALNTRYDKIHLFDVNLPDHPPSRESDRYAPGGQAVLAHTPWGSFGMSVCYDLRFPHLYRDYAKAGANVLFIPSAFAMATGVAHWETLLRARAIENGCFVVAAAQCGKHDDGRETWGQSMIIDPWGKVLVDMEKHIGLSIAELDLTCVATTRASIPSLANERAYSFGADQHETKSVSAA
ncbi:carbon-nitrogen hydrolase family protein [Agrobacterium vitis]|uniref:Carbon-nitrogen hydrolase family protein n=1 Tax=Agrobacterium vitis TaxID=373 RepID=A0AAE4WAM9_AGRVI|nr:carbon-nitrogen hydrolase family protein [Agrobacterium vitis]MCF1501741.1 carbon-nitrogen hydrolase family protein [Allorhizobium sp. Av2]MCM2438752.1 carbon-nitrogen hydrolase family protein [Agrobacterium vitis]MUZ56969.1 carbon-nitrogen hydrolase family protein [Agrobacterium vitis]MVA69147.1 carbon-nitrogen hydrolase family protein [Agrobacterium vitis]MVA85895.1 carbon-nitrogen hydrolase family protein [Agrobacterium vitis]